MKREMKRSQPSGRRLSVEPVPRVQVTLSPRGVNLADFVAEVSLFSKAGAARPALSGLAEVERVRLGPRRLDVRGARLRIGRTDLDAEVRAGIDGRPEVSVRLRSERLDLDDLLQAVSGTGKRKRSRPAKPAGEARRREGGGMAFSVSLEAAEAIVRRRVLTALSADVEHEGAKTTAKSISFHHAGGQFRCQAEVVRENGHLTWRGDGRAEFADVDTLVQGLGGAPRAVSGRLDARFELRSAPRSQEVKPKEREKRSDAGVVGSFRIDLADGRLRTVRLAAGTLVPELSRTVGEGSKNALGWEEGGIPFRGLHVEGRLTGRGIDVIRLELQGPGMDLTLSGSLEPRGMVVDLAGKATLWLPRLVRKLPRLGGTARIAVPVRVRGPLMRPDISAGRPRAEGDLAPL